MNTNRLRTYALNTLLTIALCAIYCLLGGTTSLVLGLFISALLALVMYHEHFALGVTNSIVLLVIFTLFGGLTNALLSGVPLIALALALALGTKAKLPFGKMLVLCAFLLVADFIVNMKFMSFTTGGEFTFSRVALEVGRMLRETMVAAHQDPAMVTAIEKTVSAAVDISIMLAPAMFMIACTVMAYVLIVLYKHLQKKRETDVSFLTDFDWLQGDKMMVMLYLILALIVTIAPTGIFLSASANVLLVMSFVFVMLGASVLDWKLRQKGMNPLSRRLLLFGLLCVMTMFFFLPVLLLLLCGLTDCIFDYRHIQVKKEGK